MCALVPRGLTVFHPVSFAPFPPSPFREIEYRYHVRHVPYIAYSMKQVQSLASRDEAMANVGSRQASWRILRKIYALRVEFEQAGSLGEL